MTGSLRVQEIERAQGGWPWDWLAFRSPAALVALALLLSCARIEPYGDGGAGPLAGLVEEPGRVDAAAGPWLDAARRGHRIVVAGLASALFLGGWLLPGLSAAEQGARPALELLGAAWLLAKTGALVAATAWTGWALPRARLSERSRATALWAGPLAAAALVATAAWTWASPPRATQLLVSASLLAAVVLCGAAFGHRLRHGLSSAAADAKLSPFL
jgi:NADH-quinone oxidoreductase subunit H